MITVGQADEGKADDSLEVEDPDSECRAYGEPQPIENEGRRDRRALLIALAVALAVVLVMIMGVAFAGLARADTLTPCTNHTANVPYLDLVIPEVGGQVQSSGHVGGCPLEIGRTSSIKATLCLQFLTPADGWQPQVCVSGSKSWNRYTTGGARARQLDLVTPMVTCLVGDWRGVLTGHDSADFTATSAVTRFVVGDSAECGAFGGGD